MTKTTGNRECVLQIDGLEVQVTRKNIKNIYLRVDGERQVRVSAPFRMTEREIRTFVKDRRGWIGQCLDKRPAVSYPWDLPAGPGREAEKKKCRERLIILLPGIIASCEQRIGVCAKEWKFRDMKTRWGTCNAAKGRIWLNVWLGKYPDECVEYVVVHELVHLLERGHNSVFYGYMDAFFPDWRRVKKRLNGGTPDSAPE